MRFEWDSDKDARNIRKHGVAFADVTPVFDDPNRIEADITEDEYGEERWEAVGRPDPSRALVLSVIFTERPPDVLRIISARKAEPADVRDYYSRFPRT